MLPVKSIQSTQTIPERCTEQNVKLIFKLNCLCGVFPFMISCSFCSDRNMDYGNTYLTAFAVRRRTHAAYALQICTHYV